jgi:hypothetical protein
VTAIIETGCIDISTLPAAAAITLIAMNLRRPLFGMVMLPPVDAVLIDLTCECALIHKKIVQKLQNVE